MKANATGGSKGKKNSTATKVKVTGSSPTLQQVQATRQVTKAGYKVPKTTAAQRAEMATWLIPGGAAVKGAVGAAKVVKAVAGMAKASGTVKGAVTAERAFRTLSKADKIGNKAYKPGISAAKKKATLEKATKLTKKGEAIQSKAKIKAANKTRRTDSVLTRQQREEGGAFIINDYGRKGNIKRNTAATKSMYKKLKSSGAIKRMK